MAVYAAVAATVLGVLSANQQGMAAQAQAETAANAAEYNQAVSKRNQEIAQTKQRLTAEQYRIDASEKRGEVRRRLASIRSYYGASGFDMAGTPLQVVEDAAIAGELDAQRIEYQGDMAGYESALQVLGLQDDYNTAGFEAQAARARGKAARSASYYKMAGEAIGGASIAAGYE